MGAAEISALFKEYTASYVMTFAGYNAGRGRVRQWVAQHGDPRDPKIDAVDWVERIPSLLALSTFAGCGGGGKAISFTPSRARASWP
jgi:hypothetical protein